jgi:hypothetical protein
MSTRKTSPSPWPKAGGGDERDFGRFAGGQQALVEGAQGGMMAHGDQGGHPEPAAQATAIAADVTRAVAGPAVAVERGDADQRGQRAAPEPASSGSSASSTAAVCGPMPGSC